MKIEHAAYQVADPVGSANWYVEHLGLRVKRAQDGPTFGRFLADDGDSVMLEFYNNPRVEVPDYRQIDPLVLHVAFRSEDVEQTRARLIAAGATAEGEVQITDVGDHVAMLRDPWGLPVQLVRRAAALI